MSSKRLRIDNSAPYVPLCDWHLRLIFNHEARLWARTQTGELEIIKKKPTRRLNPSFRPDYVFNQEMRLQFSDTKEQVARLHRFLWADGTVATPPDPKEISWDGKNYHQKGERDCVDCLAGKSTYPPEVQGEDSAT